VKEAVDAIRGDVDRENTGVARVEGTVNHITEEIDNLNGISGNRVRGAGAQSINPFKIRP
jgi:hypothetical protein